ncbi:MAG TPA: ParB N-terminal domain-containing protein [Sedimentisphaerales bacterium]|nr:ParB N-terminal domain-containing protein [Sedimentisphaerales bacterium]
MTSSSQSRFELLSIDEIELDLKNPRIAKWLEMYGESPTAEQIALALSSGAGQTDDAGPSFSALKQSIMTNQGIIHPIIVNREAAGKLVVIEGNTRTQIYREFKAKGVSGSWDRIPAMIYQELPEEAIDAIRLQAHLVGVRQWDPYSKAKYLNHLRDREHLTFSQIVDFCGGDKREVSNYISAYNDMENHYRKILDSDQDFDPTRFSAFVELQTTRVNESIAKSGFSKDDFAQWVHERKLFPLNTVRKLPRILQNEQSRKMFLRDGAQEALRVLDIPDSATILKDTTLEQLARALCKRINEFRYDDLRRLKSDPESDEAEMLFDARDALIQFCEDISSEDE